MYTTTNYGFNIVEGTDMVNPLTQLNPNFTALDTDLKAVSDNTVDNATCIKTGTVHAVTRTNTNASVFKFTATGNWNTGDTMTVDGTLVSVYATDGSAPANGCYVINTEVIAAIQGTRVTLYTNSASAANTSFDDTNVSYTATNVQTAIEEASTAAGTAYDSSKSTYDKINEIATHQISYSGTTNANGEISGAATTFGMPSGAIVIAAYLERDSYSVARRVNISMYGGQGVTFSCYSDNNPIVSSAVTLSIIYVERLVNP